jgi:hypothetical protein
MKNDIAGKIPPGLRTWFLIHFFVDMLFAIPLLFFPEVIMPWFGWEYVDPVMSRLVGAALLGIGGESLFSRTAALDTYRALLRLKIIWASGAILALILGLLGGGPLAGWGFLAVFIGFLGVWIYYRIQISVTV